MLPAQQRSTAMRLDGMLLEIELRTGRVPWDGVDATMMVLREESDSVAALRTSAGPGPVAGNDDGIE